MKRKLWVLFATIVAAVALAFGISACSPFVQLPTQPQPLGTPVVSISDEGIASWEPVVHAVGYSYLIDDAAEVSTTARNVQLEDGQTIQVKATGDGSLYLDSAFSTPATYHKEPVPQLTQLATPVVSIDAEGLATWEAVPNASGYQYKLNGGEEKTLESDAELQVQLQDKDSIQVKAVGDGETYSDSEYSEAKAYTAPVKPQIIKIETPVVTIDGDGTAHWEAVAHASAYFYKIDGEDEIRTTKTSTKLQDGQTISVKACTEEEGFEDSDYSEPVKYIAPVTPPQPTRLATPEVTIDEEGLATWAEVAHASGYKYKISGGEETTLVGAELQVQLEDKQYIEVKAVGDGETYSDSPYSAAKTYNAPAKPEPTQLATPEVTIDEDGLATWTEVAHASGYKYKISGGEEMTIESGAELQVQLEDKQYIEVKAVGDGETYSDSPYSAAKTYNAPAKPEPTRLATPEVTINEEGLATWERVENATGYVCKVGGEEQEVQTELSIQLQSGDTLQVKAVSTDTEHFTESAYSDLQTYTKQPVEEKEKLLATFTLGKDTDQTETKDGSDNTKADGDTISSESYEEGPVNGYTLKITASVKDPDERLFLNAWDNKGNGCLKLGGGSGKTGKITVEVPAGVTKVIFYIAGYKSNNAVIKINGSTETITITTHSADGSYTQVVAEVPESRKVTLETSGSKTSRCKINTIEFWGEAVPELTKLDAPTLNVDSHTGDVTWEKVAGATSYTYTIDGENETTVGKDDELKVTLKNNQTISVIAKGDGTTYADSDPATQKYVHEHAYKTENNGWENDSDEGHYKKCTYCQEETEKIGHTYENGVCTECQYAHTDHKYSEEKPGECTVCHLKHTEHTYKDRNGKCHTCFAEHTGDDHVLATKTSSTHHWTECEVCGAKTAEIAHTHNTYGSDETQHWSVCECGATVPDTTKDHTYNNQNGKCDICEKEHANHDYGKSYISDDASGHHQVCTVCGNVSETVAHSTLQYTHDDDQHWQECPDCHWISGTKEGHTYNNEDQPDHCDQCGFDRNHVHQYTAWDSDDTYHWKYCPYHGDNKNFTDPGTKTLHQYDAAKGDGICTEENCKHAHTGHTFKQKNDKDNHWQECTTCYLKQSITAHTYDWKVSGEQHIHACTCGYQDVEGHAPNMQWVTTDPNNHWQKCEEAGCTVTTENEKAPHSFVCESISDEQHQEKCECGATHEAEKHTYKNGVCTNEECRHEHETHSYKWVAEGTTHNHQCTVCEKIETSHTATPDTEAGLKHEDGDTHWYTCKGAEGCDLHVNETEHDKGTVFVEKDDTNHTVQCVCGKVIKETEGHTYDGYEQTADGTKHYQQCTKCEHKTEETLHEFNETTAKPTNDEKQGNHYWECECGAKKTGEHAYDPETHKCKCDKVDPDYTAATNAAAALDRLGLATDYYYDSELTATLTTSNGDATISWSEGSDYLDIAENTLTITLPTNIGLEATETASLTAKITAGEITLNREYTLTLHKGLAHEGNAGDPFTVDDVKVIFTRLDENDYYNNSVYHIKGFVTNVDSFFHQNSKYPGLYKVSIGPELTSSFDDTSVLIFRLYWDDVVMKDPGKYTDSDIPLNVHDEIIVKGYIQKFKNTNSGNIQDEITYKGDVNPQLTYWLKESERPEKLFENNFFTELPETLTEGEDFELNLSQLNAPAGTTFTVESSNEAISVDGEDDYFILSALTPTDAPVKITIKATFQGVTASYEDYKTPWMINVKAFDYETYLQDALEAITDQIPKNLVESVDEMLEVKFEEGEYEDIELTIESSESGTIEAEKQEDGSYILYIWGKGTVQLTVTVKYTGTLTGSGESKKTDPAIEVTVVSKTAADDAKISNAYESISETITVDRKGEKDLNPAGKDTDVTLKWSYVGEANSTYPLTEAGLLTVNRLPDEALDLTLQVEISCGKGTPKTKNVTVKLEALNVSDFLDEAIGQVQVDEKLTAAEEGELKEGSYTITLPSTAEGTYFAGITFEVNSTNNTAVQIDIDGVNVTLTVTRQEEPTPITLTIKATYKGAPKESTYSFTVPAIEKPITATLNFKDNFSSYNSGWTSSYASKTIDSFKKLGVEDVSGSVELSHVSKQGSTIDDRPVLCAKKTEQYVTIKITDDNKEIASVKFDLLQWGAKTFQDIHIEYLNGSEWKSCSTTIKTPGTIQSTAKSIPSGVKQVRLSYVASEDSNTQMGLTSATIVVQTEGSGAGGDSSLTDQEKAVAAITELKGLIDEETPLTADLLLPETTVQDVTLEWEVISGDEAATVIAEGDGWKLHITPQATDTDIELYVLASCGDAGMEEWTFNLTVSKTSQGGGETTVESLVFDFSTNKTNDTSTHLNSTKLKDFLQSNWSGATGKYSSVSCASSNSRIFQITSNLKMGSNKGGANFTITFTENVTKVKVTWTGDGLTVNSVVNTSGQEQVISGSTKTVKFESTTKTNISKIEVFFG